MIQETSVFLCWRRLWLSVKEHFEMGVHIGKTRLGPAAPPTLQTSFCLSKNKWGAVSEVMLQNPTVFNGCMMQTDAEGTTEGQRWNILFLTWAMYKNIVCVIIKSHDAC